MKRQSLPVAFMGGSCLPVSSRATLTCETHSGTLHAALNTGPVGRGVLSDGNEVGGGAPHAIADAAHRIQVAHLHVRQQPVQPLAVLARAPRQFRPGQAGAPAIGAEDAQHPVVQRHRDYRTVPHRDEGFAGGADLRLSARRPLWPGNNAPFPVLGPAPMGGRLRLHDMEG